jgi:nickel superoxide dismutase
MKHKYTLIIAVLLIAGAAGYQLFGHCQIPCGIYDDPARFAQLEEHVTTIEKSMNEITKLSADENKNWNQIVRWVNNKEQHADELTHIVTYYFMAQRLKIPQSAGAISYKKYIHELTLLHGMVVHSMKAKQTVDLEQVATLRNLIEEYKASYFKK